jgi:alkylation response protein AidB-like acyl-CoA dehydrogenase
MNDGDATLLDDETLDLFGASVERYGQDKYGFEPYRALLRAAPGFSRQAWSDYAAMGWLAAARPLDDGGFDSHPVALAALMRYAGEHLALEPVFANVVLCARLLVLCGAEPAARERLEALSAGRRLFALAHAEDLCAVAQADVATVWREGLLHGRKRVVLHGDCADELIVSARDGNGLSLFAVPVAQPALRKTGYRLLDGRGAASFELAGASAVPLAVPGQAAALLEQVLNGARLALCSEVHGAVLALNRQTLAYLKERRQFGRPIGTNQALQHRMVELFMLEQEVAAVIGAAQRAMAGSPAQRQRAIMGAAAHTMGAGRHVAHEAVQLHGGIGTTDELAIGHYFKRIMVVNRLLGDRDAHMDAFARADALGSAQPGASA